MKITPVNSIQYCQYSYNKKKGNHQKHFIEVVENLTKQKKCGIIELENKVDIKI